MAVTWLPTLIPIYGVRMAPIVARGYLPNPNAAGIYANITLAKLNCDAHTASISHVPNINLWLNRPIYVAQRNFIGTTRQITQSLTWGESGDMTSTCDLHAIRTWTGLVSSQDHNQPIFTSIGGLGSNPVNYAVLFGKENRPAASPIGTKNLGNGVDNKSNPTLEKHLDGIMAGVKVEK